MNVPLSSDHLVIIDDNMDLADVFGSLLTLFDYEVHVAYSGADGLRLNREFSPQVVFCDVNMPVMSGLEVAAHIREESNSSSPFLVAITAWSGGSAVRDEILSAGFDEYLIKPVDIKIVNALLSNCPKSPS